MNQLSRLSNSIIHDNVAVYRVKDELVAAGLCALVLILLPASDAAAPITRKVGGRAAQSKPVNAKKVRKVPLPSNSTYQQPVLPEGYSLAEKQDEYQMVSGPEGQGVFSATGKLILAAKFDQVRYVGDRMFAVSKFTDEGSTHWWLFDDEGKMVAKLPDWTRIDDHRFREGLLNIGDSYSPTAFINKQGKVVLNFDMYTDVKEFCGGLAAASYSNRDGSWSGYINHQGKMVIGPFKDADLANFENNQVVLSNYPENGKPKFGVISTSGKFIIPLKFESVQPAGDGNYLAVLNGKHMVFNSAGKVILKFPEYCTSVDIPMRLEKDTWIACGFGGNGNRERYSGKVGSIWGYCDIHGNIVMTPRFASAQSFKGNRAVAYVARKEEEQSCGVIDRNGKWLVEPKYQYISITDDAHWTLGPLSLANTKFMDAGHYRALVFEDLLQKHDFIGMELCELEKVLGKLDSPPYLEQMTQLGVKSALFSLTPHATCGAGSSTLQFAFDENNKITGWRVLSGGYPRDSQTWITENVVAENDAKGLQLGNLVPKK
ncbi:MAG: WG repeat-containing protein [Candidatus Obscuribacterales bacterium]|nr:WG repeat-containing protein [Candidatus Obscuribacterales bacterium]